MRRVFKFLPVVALLFGSTFLTGCSTMLGGGGHEPVTFTSKTPGTEVRVFDHKGAEISHGTAPLTVDLRRGQGYMVPAKYSVRTAAAPNGPYKETTVKAGFNGMYLGNVLFGGLIGMLIVDPISGAMWDLPNKVEVAPGKPVDEPVKLSRAP